jgi:hypothetical protein
MVLRLVPLLALLGTRPSSLSVLASREPVDFKGDPSSQFSSSPPLFGTTLKQCVFVKGRMRECL